jgi:TonB-linked SusC/RagA family outer membrane protein
MKKIIAIFLCMAAGYLSMAQTRQLTGVVTNSTTSAAVVAATVKVKNNSSSTVTNADGRFSFNVPTGNIVLEVTSVGFAKLEVDVAANSNSVSIQLTESSTELGEVVVTAFGIRKEKKALAYSVTQLDGDQFTQSRTANIGNALSGKIAGVNVSAPATGAGGSTRVVIRGGSTLGGNDQPLYVINGIPMESGNLGSAGLWGGNDAGDGLASINPDDIENISVLKGNTASALYGARAANGVILITTKSGKARKGIGVSFNSNITMDNVMDQTDFQKEFGPGEGIKPPNQNDALNAGSNHWGGRLDGSQVIQFDGQNRPYSHTGEGLKDFYETGVTINNSLALSGGNESGNYRLAVSDLNNKDIMPNATFRRQAVNFNINSKLKKLTLSASGQYTKQKAKNRPRLSDSPGNGNFSVIMMPNTLPFDVIKGTTDKYGALPDGYELRYQGNVFVTNPYWAAYQFMRSDETNRFLGNISLRYDLTKWLYVQGRFGTDFQNRDNASSEAYGTAYKPRGDFNESFQNIREDNYDLFIGGNKTFGDFAVDVLLGGNKMRRRYESKGGGGNDLVVPFVHSVKNVAAPSFSYDFNQLGINSVFGSANVSYRNYLFLNATARQDRFSTLSPDDNSILYPSVGVSAILSDIFNLPSSISFAKLRTSWAQVGGGGPTAYQLLLAYGLVGAGHNGGSLGQITNGNIPNPALKPYLSTEIEIGADIRFIKNRFGIDIAYYSRKTTDDILSTSISSTSGFGSTLVNVGELTNKGIELLLNAAVIDNKDWRWELTLNFAKNKSKAVNLGNDASGNPVPLQNLEESRVRRERIRHVLGEPLGMITGYKHRTDDKGQKMYTPEGYPIATAGYETIAEGIHPISAGLNSALRYKNFRMEFLIDVRQGGHLVSGTNYFAYSWGLHKETLNGRDGSLKVTGILQDGTPLNTTVTAANIDNYWARYAQITENVVYDASFGKLRQLSLGYTLPAKFLSKTPLESLSVSLVGRNLLLLWSNVPNIDPESAYTTGAGSQGLEFYAMPQTRSFGINIAANF